ncbi:MAG TPA: DNA-formamidopyrimidine glycosylase family protein [Candidatus Limnocylindria bacterium]|nr:DNA-formamidopyrimidine glycosylase family protein [Candidatus Limnocylindria bacterium]
MPELPDLAILADALDTSLSGRRLAEAATPQSLVLRGTPAELAALTGQQLLSVTRRGKFLTFAFERDRLVINAMLTGRLGLARPGDKPLPQTAARFGFGPAEQDLAALARRSEPVPAWPGAGGAAWLPPRKEPAEMRYRDATRMGKLYLLPAGVTRPVAGWDEQGPDANDPALTLDVWRDRIRHYSGELKNVLRNQAFVAGIGNAYSDEILWAARLAPSRKRASLAPDEVDALYEATRSVLAWAVAELRERVPPRLEVEQRSFLKVHPKGGSPCPRCGSTISEVSAGGFVTSWCRTCQR